MLRNRDYPADPGRSEPGTTHVCRRFLQLYSDYRDDRLDDSTRAEVTAHMAECASCRRYDRVIRTGVAVLRNSLGKDPEALVDRGRTPANHWPIERGGYSRPAVTGLTASVTLVVIALNLASGWSPRVGRDAPDTGQPPVTAVAPSRPDAPVHLPLPPLVQIPRFVRGPAEAKRDKLLEFQQELGHAPAPGLEVAEQDPD